VQRLLILMAAAKDSTSPLLVWKKQLDQKRIKNSLIQAVSLANDQPLILWKIR